MMPTLQVARKVDIIALARQIQRGLCLAIHMGLHDIPALADRISHHDRPVFLTGSDNPSNWGTNTRSAPKRAHVSRQTSPAFGNAVMTTASNGTRSSSNDLKTGTPTNLCLRQAASTTATTSTETSMAQIVAISARSEAPASTMREKPLLTASLNNSPYSPRAWRNSENE